MPVPHMQPFVDRCRAGHPPAAIANLPSGWVVMGERQVLPGYCLLLPDPVVPHLNALDRDDRAQFLFDIPLVGDVLLAITPPARINYPTYATVDPPPPPHRFPPHTPHHE